MSSDIEFVPASEVVHAAEARPTRSQAELDREARVRADRQVNLQRAAVIIVGIVLVGLVFVFGSGTGGNLDDVRVGGHG